MSEQNRIDFRRYPLVPTLLLTIFILFIITACTPVIVSEELPPLEVEIPEEPIVAEPLQPETEEQVVAEPVAEVVEEEVVIDDSAESPAVSVELDLDTAMLAHADAIAHTDDNEDWVAFTTAQSDEAVVTWVTLACEGAEESVRATRLTLWDASGELDTFRPCGKKPRYFELEAGHTYLARVHFKDEGEFVTDYSLTISHTTQGLAAAPLTGDDWLLRPLSAAMPTASFSGEASYPDLQSSTDKCCFIEYPESGGDIVNAWISFSCIGDGAIFEIILGKGPSPVAQVACNAEPVQVSLDLHQSDVHYGLGVSAIDMETAEVPAQDSYYIQWSASVSLDKPAE